MWQSKTQFALQTMKGRENYKERLAALKGRENERRHTNQLRARERAQGVGMSSRIAIAERGDMKLGEMRGKRARRNEGRTGEKHTNMYLGDE